MLTTTDKALQKIYRNATDFHKKSIILSDEQVLKIEAEAGIHFSGARSTEVVMHEVYAQHQMIGYAFEDVVMGKWGLIHYLVGLDTKGLVSRVIILDYQEIRGRPIAKKRFLRQYKGKGVNHPLKLRKDIDGVTGATISSRSLTDGVRKLLYIFKEVSKSERLPFTP